MTGSRGAAARRLDGLLLRTRSLLWTRYMYSAAGARGARIGRGTTFYGRCRLHLAPGSTLVVGERCRLRSAVWSNLAGLDRPCILATLYPGAELILGEECALSATVISAASSVMLGSRVFCGANVTITDTDWHGIPPEERRQRGAEAPVVLEDDVWLGMGVTVLKGVTIGQGTVISAGSLVNRSLPPFVIAGGNPAQVIRELEVPSGGSRG